MTDLPFPTFDAEPLCAVPISPRQADVLTGLRLGLTGTEIARRLHVAEGTVNTHIKRLRVKFDADDRHGIVAAAATREVVVVSAGDAKPKPATPVTVVDGYPCTADPERMFPEKESGISAAKRVCNVGGPNGTPCPQKDACLSYALRSDVRGIWAATTPKERQDIRNREGIVAEPLTFAAFAGPLHGTPARAAAERRETGKTCRICLDATNRYKHPDNPSQWDGRAS